MAESCRVAVDEQRRARARRRRRGRRLQLVDRHAEADPAGDVRRCPPRTSTAASLYVVFSNVTERDHVAAALVRRQLLEPRLAAVERADARRPVHLVAPRPRRSRSRASSTSIGRCGAACAPSTRTGTLARVGERDELLDRVDGAERVRDVRHRDEPRPRRQALLELVDRHLALVGDRHDARASRPSSRRRAATARCSSGAPAP